MILEQVEPRANSVAAPSPSAKVRGFTLVELLVVIGIISVLIGILLPALSKARRAANNVACASNMTQIYNAIMMYAGDWKTLPGPMVRCSLAPDVTYNTWKQLNGSLTSNMWTLWMPRSTANYDGVQHYLSGHHQSPGDIASKVWECPANTDVYDLTSSLSSTYSGWKFGYAYVFNNQSDTNNSYFFGIAFNGTYTGPVADLQPKKLAQIRAAGANLAHKGAGTKSFSDIWMMSDVDSFNDSAYWTGWWQVDKAASSYPSIYQMKYLPPHNKGTATMGRNYLFFDGHVQQIPFNRNATSVDQEFPYNSYNVPQEVF